MVKRAPVNCDQCKTAYTPVVTERSLPDSSVRLEMTCPHCEAIYPIARITETGIRLRARMQRLSRLGLMRTPQYRAVHERYQKQVTRLATAAQTTQEGSTP